MEILSLPQIAALTVSIALLSGCTSISPVINSDGPIKRQNSFQYNQFLSSFDDANHWALEVSDGTLSNSDPKVQAAYTQMVIDGFSLADANCEDYFRGEGQNQQGAMLARDLVAAAGTLATAVASAASVPSGVTTAFSVSTATAYNGLDVYQRNFLFGSDNIEAVKALIKKALDADTAATFKDAKSNPWIGFGQAATRIMDHQEICFPASILSLTRAAINVADVKADPTVGGGVTLTVTGPPAQPAPPPPPLTPVKVPGIIVGITPDDPKVAARRTALLQYVRSLPTDLQAADVSTSELHKIAVALSAPQSTDLSIQRDDIVAFIRAAVSSGDPTIEKSQMDTISAELAKAGITQKF